VVSGAQQRRREELKNDKYSFSFFREVEALDAMQASDLDLKKAIDIGEAQMLYPYHSIGGMCPNHCTGTLFTD
jgi:hypothetical protein